MQLDAIRVCLQPSAPAGANAMKRGVVDNEEDLPFVALHQPLEELQERVAVEDAGEAVGELRVVQCQRAVHMGGLAFPASWNARLNAYAMPRPVQRRVQLEACLILEEQDPSTLLGFFLIAGSVLRIHRS